MLTNPFRVGQWVSDSVFVESEEQPPNDIRSIKDAKAWVLENIKIPGDYEIIKRLADPVHVSPTAELLVIDGEGARVVDPTKGYVNDPNLPRFKFVETR